MNTVSKGQEKQVLSSDGEVSFLPLSLLSTSRREFYDGKHRKPGERSLQLTVKAGLSDELTELPADLIGSMFMIAPAGLVDSPKVEGTDTILPTQDGWTHLLNGDGMVYRVDFGQPKPKFSCRLMSNVSYYADKITHQKYPVLKFVTFGIARLSNYIGASNQSNTAFLKFSDESNNSNRLLVTSDVERPIEINPSSLRIIAPVGLNREWEAPLKIASKNKPIQSILTTAHLVTEPDSNNIITINVVKSLWKLVTTSLLKALSSNGSRMRSLKFFSKILFLLFKIADPFVSWLLKVLDIDSSEKLYLLRWNSETDDVERWEVLLSNGCSIPIEQTVHQMGITEDYIVFADTAFKVAFSSTLPGPDASQEMEESQQNFFSWLRLHRKYLNFPLRQDTALYIVSRKQFDEIKPGGTLVAQKVLLLDAAIVHYQVDYRNPDGNIHLHAALNQATDFSEFLHSKDSCVFKDSETLTRASRMAGMFSGGMKVNRPKTYVIDVDLGKVIHETSISLDDAYKYTFSLGAAAFKDDTPTQQYKDIYWSNVGAWPEIILEDLADLYKSPKEKETREFKRFLTQMQSGVPTSICRIHIDQSQEYPAISVADSYQFPVANKIAYYGNSPQFVPRPNTTQSTDGYIVCSVNYSDQACSASEDHENFRNSWSRNSEIWIFDAEKLNQGPLYRLSHAQLNFGMTIHTTWLKKIVSPIKQRKYDVSKDFEHLVASAMESHSTNNPYEAKLISQLFQEIYAEIEKEQGEANS